MQANHISVKYLANYNPSTQFQFLIIYGNTGFEMAGAGTASI